ncbi:homoserine O- acetyltransferase, partial [Podochytrium sp. JEL0797]
MADSTPPFEHFADLIPGQSVHILDKVVLEASDTVLTDVPIAYKTWGTLNERGDNCM